MESAPLTRQLACRYSFTEGKRVHTPHPGNHITVIIEFLKFDALTRVTEYTVRRGKVVNGHSPGWIEPY
jgi:hypothetical protein